MINKVSSHQGSDLGGFALVLYIFYLFFFLLEHHLRLRGEGNG